MVKQRNFPSIQVCNFQKDCVLICGHFEALVGGIVANSRFGRGWTVARTGVGQYTVTTDDPYRHVIACGSQYCMATVEDRFMADNVPTGGAGAQVVWALQVWDFVTGAAEALAGDEIHFWMLLSTSYNDTAAW